MNQTRCEGEWEDDDDLEDVDDDDVGEAEVDVLPVQFLLDYQKEDDEVSDTADDDQDYEEEENDGQQPVAEKSRILHFINFKLSNSIFAFMLTLLVH